MGDEFPDPVAQLDQALKAVVDFARVVRAYYEALLKAGFDADQALMLTAAYQSNLFTSSS